MRMRIPLGALAASLVFATGAAEARDPPGPSAAAPAPLPTAPAGAEDNLAAELREEPRTAAPALIGRVPLADNAEIGIGRFDVLPIARPRTNMERERAPTDMRFRDRGIAGLGLRIRF